MRGRGGKIKGGRGMRVSKKNGWETGNPRRRAQKRSNITRRKKKKKKSI